MGPTIPSGITTRFVLELKAISDGKRWHPAAGRAIVIVAGDRHDVPAGSAVEAAGQLAKVARPLNPGEFDYRAYLQAQGIRLRLTVDEPESFWRDPDGTVDVLAGWLGSLKEWSHARLVERLDPAIAPSGSRIAAGPARGSRTRGQRCVRTDRYDPFTGDLGAPVASVGGCAPSRCFA